MERITIAGTAGRKEDARLLDAEVYDLMIEKTLETILEASNAKEPITLVSGGAAYADHIAVKLYLAHPDIFNLKLYLPAPFEAGKFRDTGDRDWKTNPGGTSNFYHRQFSQKTGTNSFNEIQKAIDMGAEVEVHDGFFARNAKMADSEIAICLTFGENGIKDGGTKNMADAYLKKHKVAPKLYHIPIAELTQAPNQDI